MQLEDREIGNYRIISKIGQGASGFVYLAEDPRIQQRVAMKVIQIEPGGDLTQFRSEARIVAQLKHPHIVRLNTYDEAVVDEMPIIYFVMPYYKDGSLAQWFQERGTKGLPVDDVLHLIGQGADALQYAHTFHVVHGDVKPSNFLIDTEGIPSPNRPNLLLTDFGVARFTASSTTRAGLSYPGGLMYTSPEQLNGQASAASDQYALAIIAYELLTGQPPFLGTPPNIMRQHLETPPDPPSTKNSSIPKSIDDVILRALAKKPEDRWGSVEAFSTAIQRKSGVIEPPRRSPIPPVNDQPWSTNPPPPRDPQPSPSQLRGNDAYATLFVNSSEAQAGAVKQLMVNGRSVTVHVPPNTYNGMAMHIGGLGELSPTGGQPGMLHVTVNIAPQPYQSPPPGPAYPAQAYPAQGYQVPPPPPPSAYQNPPGQMMMPPLEDGTQPSFPPSKVQRRNLAQDHLQFTAFHPRIVPVETWNTLLVYTHIESSLEPIRADAARFKDKLGPYPSKAEAWASRPLARGTQITVVPTFQGVIFNPERIVFAWKMDWHPAIFSFSAHRRWAGAVGNGEITIFTGPLIIASLKISLRFEEQILQPSVRNGNLQEEVSVSPYRKIFASYSHDDTHIVLAIRKASEVIGDESLMDIANLRSGQNWNQSLLKLIDISDIFQLFWSDRAANSYYVRQEFEYALQHYKYDGFIRPVYWEKPMRPPPPELSHLHFAYYELPQKNSLFSRFYGMFKRG